MNTPETPRTARETLASWTGNDFPPPEAAREPETPQATPESILYGIQRPCVCVHERGEACIEARAVLCPGHQEPRADNRCSECAAEDYEQRADTLASQVATLTTALQALERAASSVTYIPGQVPWFALREALNRAREALASQEETR